MSAKGCVVSLLFFTRLLGASNIPETLSTDSFSVSLALPSELWSAAVLRPSDAIQYSYGGFGAGSEVYQLTVSRVIVPASAAALETSELVNQLIRSDGLDYQRATFGRKIVLRAVPEISSCPVGTAYLLAPDLPVFQQQGSHYAAIALLLPADYRIRKVGYLIVGHQLGRRGATQEQLKYLHLILGSLKEKPADRAAAPFSKPEL